MLIKEDQISEKLQQEYLLRIIQVNETLSIPICDEKGDNIGIMRPITRMHLECNEVIEKMTNWRNQYNAFFLTQFKATPERTKQWLEKVVLSNPTELMFLIYCGDSLVGQYGFKDLKSDSASLGNLLRGERGGHPGLMRFAVLTLADWLFDVMRVNEVYGYIFANNPMALKLHKDLGFLFMEKFPLRKQIEGEEIRWIVGNRGEPSPDNHYYQKIILFRNPRT